MKLEQPTELQMQVRRKLLASDRRLQQDAIARHYSALADMAMDLRELISLRDQGLITDESASSIEYLCQQIETYHLIDFGVALFPTMDEAKAECCPNCKSTRLYLDEQEVGSRAVYCNDCGGLVRTI